MAKIYRIGSVRQWCENVLGHTLIFRCTRSTVHSMESTLKKLASYRLTWVLPFAMLLIAGCATQQATPTPTVVIATIPTTVQLSWYHQAQFSGFYAAVDQGYYAAEHLNVQILS